jgi:hypothetical protein
MTYTELFAFIILPISVAALGWVIVLLNDHFRNHRQPPASDLFWPRR